MKAADEEDQIVEMSHSKVGDGGIEDPGLGCPDPYLKHHIPAFSRSMNYI